MSRSSASRASTAPAVATPPVILTAFELCEALRRGGFVLSAVSRDTLSIRPRAGVTDQIAQAITHHKPALLELFAETRAAELTPHPCAYCTARFVRADGDWCGDCQPLFGQPMRFEPDSAEERLFLIALEKRKKMQENLPNVPNEPSGNVRENSARTFPTG
jgi:hypothetical protein